MNVALKPFRSYSEHDVINLFALDAASGDKGSMVKITSASGFVSNQIDSFSALTSQANVVSWRPSLLAKVGLAASGEGAAEVLGMMLYDVREYNEYGYPLLYDAQRRAERECVVSGQAVPLVTKGLFLISGSVGTPGPGSGALIDDAGEGVMKVVAQGTANSIGKFLGAKDGDGYALFKLDL